MLQMTIYQHKYKTPIKHKRSRIRKSSQTSVKCTSNTRTFVCCSLSELIFLLTLYLSQNKLWINIKGHLITISVESPHVFQMGLKGHNCSEVWSYRKKVWHQKYLLQVCNIPPPLAWHPQWFAVTCVTFIPFSALTQLGGRKGIRPVKTEWWVAGMVICLEWGADLHMAQLMPLLLTVSCFSKNRLVLPFWYRLTRVVLEKQPLNGCVCNL